MSYSVYLLFLISSYPREQAQGAAFERIIAPVDLILYFECSNVSDGDSDDH